MFHQGFHTFENNNSTRPTASCVHQFSGVWKPRSLRSRRIKGRGWGKRKRIRGREPFSSLLPPPLPRHSSYSSRIIPLLSQISPPPPPLSLYTPATQARNPDETLALVFEISLQNRTSKKVTWQVTRYGGRVNLHCCAH